MSGRKQKPNCDICRKIQKKRVDLLRIFKKAQTKKVKSLAQQQLKKYTKQYKTLVCSQCYKTTKKAVKAVSAEHKKERLSRCRNCVQAIKFVRETKGVLKHFKTKKDRDDWKRIAKDCYYCGDTCDRTKKRKKGSCDNYNKAGDLILKNLLKTLKED